MAAYPALQVQLLAAVLPAGEEELAAQAVHGPVWCSAFRVEGVGCGVEGVGCGVEGVGCGVEGEGCVVQGVGCGVEGVWCGVWGVGCGVEGVGCGVQGAGSAGAIAVLEGVWRARHADAAAGSGLWGWNLGCRLQEDRRG